MGEVSCGPAEQQSGWSYQRLLLRREDGVVASVDPEVDGSEVKSIGLTLKPMGVRRVAAPDLWVAVHDDAMAVLQNISGVAQTLVDVVVVAAVARLLPRSIVDAAVTLDDIVTV